MDENTRAGQAKTDYDRSASALWCQVRGETPPGVFARSLPTVLGAIALLGGVRVGELARPVDQVQSALAHSGEVSSSLGIHGNGSSLENGQADLNALAAWNTLIDGAHLFGCNIVARYRSRTGIASARVRGLFLGSLSQPSGGYLL